MELTLHVIFAAGYGRRLEWEQSDELWSGHQMSRGSLRTVIDNIPVFMFISEAWRKILPFKYLRTLEQSFSESNQYFREFIALEKQEKPSNNGNRTILGLLVEDTAETDLQKGDILPEKEIIGNAFIFLLAGHETTYASSDKSKLTLVPMFSYIVFTYWRCILQCKMRCSKKSTEFVATILLNLQTFTA